MSTHSFLFFFLLPILPLSIRFLNPYFCDNIDLFQTYIYGFPTKSYTILKSFLDLSHLSSSQLWHRHEWSFLPLAILTINQGWPPTTLLSSYERTAVTIAQKHEFVHFAWKIAKVAMRMSYKIADKSSTVLLMCCKTTQLLIYAFVWQVIIHPSCQDLFHSWLLKYIYSIKLRYSI